jgi:hypothetical protein
MDVKERQESQVNKEEWDLMDSQVLKESKVNADTLVCLEYLVPEVPRDLKE